MESVVHLSGIHAEILDRVEVSIGDGDRAIGILLDDVALRGDESVVEFAAHDVPIARSGVGEDVPDGVVGDRVGDVQVVTHKRRNDVIVGGAV